MTADRPKLRKLDRHRLRRGGEELLVLRDPLGVADPVALPAAAAPILDLLDGQRSAAQIRHSLLLRGAASFPADAIAELIADLGAAGLLDDDAFRARWAALLRDFLAAPIRRPAHADVLYPGDPAALRGILGEILGEPGSRVMRGSRLCGVVAPHQPFDRAAAVLDATLRELPPAEEIDLVVVLGTDHHPGLVPYVLTDKPHATPLGELPIAASLVAELSERLPWLRREEIRHRQAISVELAAVLLAHLYPSPPPIVPILCGQTALASGEGSQAADDLMAALERLLAGKRVLWWASAELTHAGPAYGGQPLLAGAAEAIIARDRWLIDPLLRGQPEALARRMIGEDDALGRPSGAAVLVTLARLLPLGVRGEVARHLVLPAPGGEDGLAGLLGVQLRG